MKTTLHIFSTYPYSVAQNFQYFAGIVPESGWAAHLATDHFKEIKTMLHMYTTYPYSVAENFQ